MYSGAKFRVDYCSSGELAVLNLSDFAGYVRLKIHGSCPHCRKLSFRMLTLMDHVGLVKLKIISRIL